MSGRMIEVTTDVYAAIWSSRRPGENSEDEILRRLMKVQAPEPTAEALVEPRREQQTQGGVFDRRNGVRFPEGFQIFRSYKGKRFEAVATSGRWRRSDTGKVFASLNQLNRSIVAGQENVWNGNWRYRTEDGKDRSIEHLRK